jgi:hypothetical protein
LGSLFLLIPSFLGVAMYLFYHFLRKDSTHTAFPVRVTCASRMGIEIEHSCFWNVAETVFSLESLPIVKQGAGDDL